MRTGIVYHESYLKHNLGLGHPERPERLKSVMELLKQILDNPNVKMLRPEPVAEDDLLRVQSGSYVEEIRSMSERGGMLTLDTPLPMGTYDVAKLACGGAILAGGAVVKGDVENAFALTRPPGHHAGRDYGGGFCFFNNIAVMIEYLKEKYGLRRFAVLDWDVHHGNGTQDIFYEDPSVLYFSTHQSPLYPGTGSIDENGDGRGEGYNVNVPLRPGTSGANLIYILRELFNPLVEEYKPELIGVSAGYDAYFNDPLANLKFTIETYAETTRLVRDLASKVCGGRIAVVLEGGYQLEAVSHGVLATISTLAGIERWEEPYPPPKQELSEDVREKVSELKRRLSRYWKIS